MRVHQQAAYVLLNRPYSESSWIVDVFSKDFGRIALIAKGARRLKSRLKGVLLPFQPLLISWSGKGEVPTLVAAEIQNTGFNFLAHELRGDGLACGFYCNELVSYLLHRYDPHPELFSNYHQTMHDLYAATDRIEKNLANDLSFAAILREFERRLIKETGYEVNFEFEADGKTPLDPLAFYDFLPGRGFVKHITNVGQNIAVSGIQGQVVLAMRGSGSGDVVEHQNGLDMSLGKHLMRDILRQSLGQKKINSRELFFPKST